MEPGDTYNFTSACLPGNRNLGLLPDWVYIDRNGIALWTWILF
jgi:hypothetical protein